MSVMSQIMDRIAVPEWTTTEIEWSDFLLEEQIPSDTELHWLRSSIFPKPNDLRIVNIPKSKLAKIEEPFYGLFSPALSFFNGWDCHPEEINQHVLYKAKLVESIRESSDVAWVKLVILESVLFKDIDQLISVKKNGNRELLYGIQSYSKYKDWFIINYNDEGDLGYELLFLQHKDYFQLVYVYDWFFSDTNIEIVNEIYTKEKVLQWVQEAEYYEL
jgi:hypothetical protein